MADFLKQNPYVSREEYIWKWTIPQIRLVSFDFTHVNYLTEKQAADKNAVRTSPDDLANDLGIPILG